MKHRYQILWLVPVVIGIGFFWPKQNKGGTEQSGVEGENRSSHSEELRGDSPASGNRNHTARDRDPSASATPSPLEEQDYSSAEVDEILSDQSITDEEAARRLRRIVENLSQPLKSRMEALQHGVTLSLPSFSGLAEQQPQLPVELAEIFLPEVMNWNDSPVDQVRTYLAWLDHPAEEIAAQSLENLRFMLEDDQAQETIQRLRQLAQEKIKELQSNPADQ